MSIADEITLEWLRRERLAQLNTGQTDRQKLAAEHGQLWDVPELGRDFEVEGFMAPFVVARRRADGKVGSLEFRHHPRFYFNWQEDKR